VGGASIGTDIAVWPDSATRQTSAFSDDPARNIRDTIMPENGQLCVVDDLNHRSGPVADPAAGSTMPEKLSRLA
jgi:hypothetical protein